jgi:hypothetical protein
VDPSRARTNYFNASIKDFSQNFAADNWMSPNATTFVRAPPLRTQRSHLTARRAQANRTWVYSLGLLLTDFVGNPAKDDQTTVISLSILVRRRRRARGEGAGADAKWLPQPTAGYNRNGYLVGVLNRTVTNGKQARGRAALHASAAQQQLLGL